MNTHTTPMGMNPETALSEFWFLYRNIHQLVIEFGSILRILNALKMDIPPHGNQEVALAEWYKKHVVIHDNGEKVLRISDHAGNRFEIALSDIQHIPPLVMKLAYVFDPPPPKSGRTIT